MNRFLVFLVTSITLITLLTFPISAHSPSVTIQMTPDGFSSQDITVDENTIITFINKDTRDRWPASNLHPTHELYPQFDPKKAIPQGEFWLFKSQKVGTWKYHDHLFPHLRATLTVTAEPGADSPKPSAPAARSLGEVGLFQKIIRFITNLFRKPPPPFSPLSADQFKSLAPQEQYDHLSKLAEKESPQKSWEYIHTIYKGESGNQGNIHDLAHFAGNLLFKKGGFPNLKDCTPVFAFGCFHGFLDAAFANSLDQLGAAETACNTLGPVGSGPVASCIHGIGHGIASFYQTQDLTKSLQTCDQLQNNQAFCYDGVFMEFARAAPSAFYKPDEPLYPCNQVSKSVVFSCARNLPTVLMQRFQKTYPEVAKLCLNQSNRDLKEACIDSLGFMAASQNQSNATGILQECRQIPSLNFQNRCIIAAAGELVFQEVPNWQETSKTLCSSIKNRADRNNCTTHINRLIQEYGRDKQIYLLQEMKNCLDQGAKNDCYKQIAASLSKDLILKDSLALVHQNEQDPAVYARCHEVTHYLSRNEYTKSKSVPQVYAQCDSTCHGGCYHGALEQYLKDHDLASTFTTVCDQVKNTTPLIYNECFHGMGHAAMFVTEAELPQSLALCDGLPDQNARERCYSGAFMENSSSSTNLDHPSKYIKADDPLYPCNNLEEKYQQLCYRYQSSHFALLTRQNWPATANLCLQVPPQYQLDCFRTIGTNQVGFTQDIKVMTKNCTSMPKPEFQEICITGVVSSLSYRFVGLPQKMIDFCSQVPATYQEICFKQMGLGLKDWSTNPAEVTRTCSLIPNPQHSSWCTSAS